MSTISTIKNYFIVLVLLCLVLGMNQVSRSQSAPNPNIILTKDDPVITERFADVLSTMDPQSPVKVWVFFTDKGFTDQASYQSALNQTIKTLTPRTSWRRSKTMKFGLADFRDIPVNQTYIDRIIKFNAVERQRSRWLNAASFEIPMGELKKISALSFVRSIKPVLGGKRKPIDLGNVQPEPVQEKGMFTLNYGSSYSQLQQINLPAVHSLGYYGQGVIVCMMDTGFRKDHQAFQLAYSEGRVLAEWDFINQDGNTQNETGDPSSQHNHGTMTWSTLGGASDGNLYGPAYGAYFILAKTEDTGSETSIEEDNWVAGMEWADSIGADVISSSLGYIDWYTFPDLDGNTAVTTIAADIAAQLGIVVCNAMGNEGSGSGSLIAPADADSIIACGAVDGSGNIAYFSSRGPTYDGRIKPEVCARGVSTRCANPSSTTGYTTADGTSLSTPLIGGAAAVILSAHPNWTPMQVREAMIQSGNNSSSPNNTYGWGIPDILAAIQYSFYLTGDVTGDGEINVSDLIFLIDYLYRNGRAPSPLFLGDVNCDEGVNISDVVYLINFVYQNGTEPCSH